MKLLTFVGLCLVIHLSFAQVGKQKVPPFRTPKNDELDGMFKNNGEKIIQKRETFLPGKEKVPPFRPVKDDKIEETFGEREKRSIGNVIPPIVQEKEGDKINGMTAEHLDSLKIKREVADGNDLPLLLKTLRLREGSTDDINRITDDYVNGKKGEAGEAGGEEGRPELPGRLMIGKNRRNGRHYGASNSISKPEDEEPRLLGEPLIGKNRHPKDETREKRSVDEKSANLPLLLKTLRLRPGSQKDFYEIIENYIQANKPEEEEDVQKDGRQGNAADDNDLPLLLKTLRLREGSTDDINTIIDNYVNAKKGDGEEGRPELPGKLLIGKNRHQKGQKDEKDNGAELGSIDVNVDTDDLIKRSPIILADKYDRMIGVHKKDKRENDEDTEELVDVRPLGMGLIGKFRRPPIFPDDKQRTERGNDKPFKVACKEEDRQQVLKCFRGYFKNFDLELVDGKLPSMHQIFQKFKEIKDYEKHQKYFKDFSGCFKSTPESCFHSDQLSNIAQQGEADYIATFFTVSEFSFKSKHNKKVAKCFIKQVEKCSTHKPPTTDLKECESAKNILVESIQKFNENCAKTDPQDGDLKSLLKPFIQRTSLGENCPNLLSDINL